MGHHPSPLTPPTLRSDLPVYPLQLQLVRVGSTTVPGPSGYGSSSFLGPLLFIAAVQQLRTDTLLPRDREPCFALDVSGLGLAPGYYLGRLAGSYQSLPVYEVGGAGGATAISLPGLTPTQASALLIALSPAQIAVLNNLNACQLQVFLGLTTPQQQILTGSLTPTQLANLVDSLTLTQLQNIITTLNIPQIQQLTTALTQQQIQQLTQVLTPAQISTLLQTLTLTQLLALTTLSPAEILYVVTNDSTSQLQSLLNTSPLPVPVPATASNQLRSYPGTTTATYVQIFDVTDSSGLHGTIVIKNTGGANSLQYRVTATDDFGTTSNAVSTIIANGNAVIDLDSYTGITGLLPPYIEFILEVEDFVAASHTTFIIKRALTGSPSG